MNVYWTIYHHSDWEPFPLMFSTEELQEAELINWITSTIRVDYLDGDLRKFVDEAEVGVKLDQFADLRERIATKPYFAKMTAYVQFVSEVLGEETEICFGKGVVE